MPLLPVIVAISLTAFGVGAATARELTSSASLCKARAQYNLKHAGSGWIADFDILCGAETRPASYKCVHHDQWVCLR